MSVRTLRVRIAGIVQGVGYRAWVEHEAQGRGLSGWVRNRRDGTVEALFAGPSDQVEEMVAACRLGPRLAQVSNVAVAEAEHTPPAGFSVLPTE